ncbi:SDR family oxidoreductase [Pseudorhodoferax sp. Leaf265]|uniref:SDR family oxidoreductase n=1 Tax=Pseudorhodoferax sp. Leaf265 TaxID=1736315 RepID=UPI0009E8F021|nr:SDR family oxidoreductase [Pseudorhodoferax sp. Leaf265]
MNHWTASDIPPLHGRTAVVTGTGGLGLQDALALARAGASVVLAGRNPAKGRDALQQIRHSVPQAKVVFAPLDLASLASVAAFGQALRGSHERIDLLVNNAAVMAPPQRRQTADGFELQFGTNHLGHFALTAALLPLLRKGHAPRVVSVSSIAARNGRIAFDDLQAQRHYAPMQAYAQSKLACLLFALELQRRSDAAGWGIQSMAAHPGIARTDLLPNGAGAASLPGLARRWLWFLFQPAAQGAWPTLYAATAPQARGGQYHGPHRLSETRGHPAPARVPAQALDTAAAARLWVVSQQLTGAVFGDGPAATAPGTARSARLGVALAQAQPV